jgi:hypothetical protein
VDPSRSCDQLSVFVFLRVFAHTPDIAVVVLRKEGKFRFHQLVIAVVQIPSNNRANASDHLGQIGDMNLYTMREKRTVILDCGPFVYETHPRLHGHKRVVYLRRPVEVVRVELRELLVEARAITPAVLRPSAARKQSRARDGDDHCQERRRDRPCSLPDAVVI